MPPALSSSLQKPVLCVYVCVFERERERARERDRARERARERARARERERERERESESARARGNLDGPHEKDRVEEAQPAYLPGEENTLKKDRMKGGKTCLQRSMHHVK
jgi:hypothetical protein